MIWITKDFLGSDAFRLLSAPAHRALFRIIIEHVNHAGLENGRLKVTYRDFEAYSCRYRSIKKAIEELVRQGLSRSPAAGGDATGKTTEPQQSTA